MTGNDMFFDIDNNQLKKNKKQVHFTLPYLGTPVAWNNTNRTYIIGLNGSGKTLLLNEMRTWCDKKSYTHISYNSVTALSEAEWYIENATDDVIRLACKKMLEFSYDFKDDIEGWAKAKDKDEEDPELLREVLRMCGAGYSRMFVMMAKAYSAPEADYYFMDLPETSLHLHLASKIVDFLMMHFEYTKFVVATHSPEVVKDVWLDNGDRDYSNVIELDFDHINQENNRKWGEIFS